MLRSSESRSSLWHHKFLSSEVIELNVSLGKMSNFLNGTLMRLGRKISLTDYASGAERCSRDISFLYIPRTSFKIKKLLRCTDSCEFEWLVYGSKGSWFDSKILKLAEVARSDQINWIRFIASTHNSWTSILIWINLLSRLHWTELLILTYIEISSMHLFQKTNMLLYCDSNSHSVENSSVHSQLCVSDFWLGIQEAHVVIPYARSKFVRIAFAWNCLKRNVFESFSA